MTFAWRRLGVLVRHLPVESATTEALHGPRWTLTDHLLASLYDAVVGGNWQRSGGKGPRPKPLPRPGVTPQRKKLGGTPRPIEEVRKILDDWHAGRLISPTKETTELR